MRLPDTNELCKDKLVQLLQLIKADLNFFTSAYKKSDDEDLRRQVELLIGYIKRLIQEINLEQFEIDLKISKMMEEDNAKGT